MRKLAPILVLLALSANPLAAQYDRRYEVGLFGAFTKYDNTFGLSNKLGGGVRFAYAVTPMIGLEVEALFQSPQDVGTAHLEPLIGGGRLLPVRQPSAAGRRRWRSRRRHGRCVSRYPARCYGRQARLSRRRGQRWRPEWDRCLSRHADWRNG